ncbi:MAG: fibronectin type III domain-containing protein [Paludibacteraceae bacterium]|nr:fibronectin type III domain-containing protein [Paludibacteraceae bacterium]
MSSFKVYLNNIEITYPETINIDKDHINFGSVALNSTNPQYINIYYSALREKLTVDLANQDGVFSVSEKTIGTADCTAGEKNITITFKPTEYGVYNNELKFSNGTSVSLHGECSTTFDTKVANFKVENVSYTSIKLKWNAVPGASGYRIINQTNGATYTVDANTTSLNATGLKMETNYSFVLYALFNGATSLNATAPVSATTLKSDIELTDCVIYDNPNDYYFVASTEQSIIYNLINDGDADYIKDDNTYTSYITFQARKMEGGAVGSPDMYLLAKVGNVYQEVKYWTAGQAGIGDGYRDYTAQIPHNTTELKFKTGLFNGTLERHVQKLKVYKDNVLTSTTSSIHFEAKYNTPSEPKTFEITYANAAPISYEIAYSNAKGTVLTEDLGFYQVNLDPTAACSEGKQTVSITFTPKDCVKDYSAILTLFNGQYLTITLNGTLQKNDKEVEHIIWNGSVSTEWDNRDNWNKTDGTPLTCADNLSEDLTVTIPGGLAQYPVIPDVSSEENFYTKRNNDWNGNQVNAGDNASATMIAKTIVLEYGAALVGVETLYNPTTGVRRYHEVINHFAANRDEWQLVGTVVKPWDAEHSDNVRNILSQDYFLYHLPQVYMHEAVIDENNNVSWKNTFESLGQEVPYNKAFAIYVANEYGPNFWTARRYNNEYGTNYDGFAPHNYTFKGHFFNESDVILYENLEAGKRHMLCNTYPAPIDAKELDKDVDGTILYYDYNGKSFVDAKTANENDAIILPQNGFVFAPNQGVTSITVDASYMMASNNTVQNRSALAEPTLCRIKATNTSKSVYSQISIGYDEYKEDAADLSIDAPKLFATETSALPDIYVMRYDANWSSVTLPDMSQPIPLGVSINAKNKTFTIEMTDNNMPYNMVLEDRTTATVYNLSAGEVCTVSGLAKGDYKGRFYLYAVPIESDDDDVTTNIDVNAAANGNIDIFTQENSVIVSATNQTKLQSIMVSDMVGRSTTYAVNGQYYQITMPNAHGIYLITVIGDAGIVTQKVRM